MSNQKIEFSSKQLRGYYRMVENSAGAKEYVEKSITRLEAETLKYPFGTKYALIPKRDINGNLGYFKVRLID